MTEKTPSASGPLLGKWISTLGMGAVVAYAAHPLITTLLISAEDLDERLERAFMPIMLGSLSLIFAAACWRLLRLPDVARRIEHGCRWSGGLLLLAIPVMLLIVFLSMRAEAGGDQGGATAAFFMLMIFGGACLVFGGLLLLIAHVMRRNRRASEG